MCMSYLAVIDSRLAIFPTSLSRVHIGRRHYGYSERSYDKTEVCQTVVVFHIQVYIVSS